MVGKRLVAWGVPVISLWMLLSAAEVRGEEISVESDRWVKRNAQVTECGGRKCLAGFAYIKDLMFDDGTIEVDLYVTGDRSYPGIVFRMQSEQDYERFYIRPHHNKYSTDALQYTPVINGIAGWQLYHGPGYTGNAVFPQNQWFRLRLEVSGRQARVFIGQEERPVLVIDNLQHGVSRGTVGVFGPPDGSAFFSRFSFQARQDLSFDPPPVEDSLPGMITEWRLSQNFSLMQFDLEAEFDVDQVEGITWEDIRSDPTGLVDIARYRQRKNREGDIVFAKTILRAQKDYVLKLNFGYSDFAAVILNGKTIFSGNSAYHYRDDSFLGIVGLFDALYLSLHEGDNELVLAVAESFGGWGFMCQDGEEIFKAAGVKEEWETGADFLMPESALYDSKRKVIYVSNLDQSGRAGPQTRQFISRLSDRGEVIDMQWVTGLANPTGMVMHRDRLLVVERPGIAFIDPDSGRITERRSLPSPGFLNDIAVDKKGRIYVSDSRQNVIYRCAEDDCEVWLSGGEVLDPNGLLADGERLIFGNSGDGRLKAVDLESGEIRTIVNLGEGFIDGLQVDKEGNYLVSIWQGKLYRVSPSGQAVKLLDTRAVEIKLADFGYIRDKGLVVIPTFYHNQLISYSLQE